jgi:hypothetical protein
MPSSLPPLKKDSTVRICEWLYGVGILTILVSVVSGIALFSVDAPPSLLSAPYLVEHPYVLHGGIIIGAGTVSGMTLMMISGFVINQILFTENVVRLLQSD